MATSFDGVCFLGTRNSAAGSPAFLEVVQGGVVSIPGREQAGGLANFSALNSKACFLSDLGLPVIPCSTQKSTNNGNYIYDPNSGEFHMYDLMAYTARRFRIGDRVGFWANSGYLQGGPSDFWRDWEGVGAGSDVPYDHVINGDEVVVSDCWNSAYRWSYPFNGAYTAVPGTTQIHRLCARQGVVYGLRIVPSGSPSIYIYRLDPGPAWALVHSFTDADSGNVVGVNAVSCNAAFFAHTNGFLYIVLTYDNGGSQLVRCYKVDVDTPSETQLPNMIPNTDPIWGPAGAGIDNSRICEIEYIDSSGDQQFLLVRSTITAVSNGWEMVNFDPDEASPWTKVASGAQTLAPVGGIVCKKDGTVSRPVEFVDHQDYLETYIQHSNAKRPAPANGIDFSYRYTFQDTMDPDGEGDVPEYTGTGQSQGTTVKPHPDPMPSIGSELDTSFDGAFDDTKFMKTNLGFNHIGAGYGMPGMFDAVYSAGARVFSVVNQAGGEITFGSASPTNRLQPYTGAGVIMKYMLTGDFAFELDLSNIQRLSTNASQYYWGYIMAMTRCNRGLAIGIRTISGVDYRGQGILFQEYPTPTSTVLGSNTLLSGDKLRIQRVGSTWNLYNEYGDANQEDVTPGGVPADYTDDVYIMFGFFTRSTSPFTTSTPGPGFTNLAFPVGNVGSYIGPYKSRFDMDLGNPPFADKNDAVILKSRYTQDTP